MNIDFWGAAGTVTGSCYQVTVGATTFLVDCGMFQGSKTLRERNYGAFPFAPDKISFVLLTHAHIDHSGLLPKLVKHGFAGPIYATAPTAELAKHMLLDSAHIQEVEVEQKNKRNERRGAEPLQPIYDQADAERTIARLQVIDREGPSELAPGVRVTLRNAGHMLGSAFAEFELTEGNDRRRVVFSGDLGSPGHPIVKDPEIPADTDFLVVESTYGDRIRKDGTDIDARRQKLAKVIRATTAHGGNVIIPGFAVGRTQDLLHDLLRLLRDGALKNLQVYVDSPLAVQVTEVFSQFPECYDEEARELLGGRDRLFDHPAFHFTGSADESKALNGKRGIVIISASGMCDAGRIKHHLKHNLFRPEATVLFVGYQAEGTLGRLLLDGVNPVRIHGEEVSVRARLETISGYSGHADQKTLLDWVAAIPQIRRGVIVTHGEPEASATFARLVQDRRGVPAVAPVAGDRIDLLASQVAAPMPVPVPADAPPALAATTAAYRMAASTKHDSYNRYAQLMIDLASFMKRESDELKRSKKLAALAAILGEA